MLSHKPFNTPASCLFALFLLVTIPGIAQPADPWKVKANIRPGMEYYGITVANGMLGIVSSPEPFRVKDVVLAG
jgi:hypothetical protein